VSGPEVPFRPISFARRSSRFHPPRRILSPRRLADAKFPQLSRTCPDHSAVPLFRLPHLCPTFRLSPPPLPPRCLFILFRGPPQRSAQLSPRALPKFFSQTIFQMSHPQPNSAGIFPDHGFFSDSISTSLFLIKTHTQFR